MFAKPNVQYSSYLKTDMLVKLLHHCTQTYKILSCWMDGHYNTISLRAMA